MNANPNNFPRRRALLVVADPAMRQLCRETLGNAGFAVAIGLDSGTAAVTTAREERPDIIILSQQLNDVPASEAVKWLRSNANLATTPIVILGGKAETVHDRIVVLPRPITAAQLRDALADIRDGEQPNDQVA
jgi:DNA-binding response OmpR family regulator